ncbi:unnamed protein product [Lymnaea stagnalis]|uniref:Integrin alpha-2 domain-containing protein n=1 Tax=Lymnaea stagnalis TaxID=6523 RepID=A0AAV2IH76_LYMST
MNGICYESGKDLHFDGTSAWPALEGTKKQISSNGFFIYGMGSLGTSAVYSRDGTFAVLGAPGINDWAGGYVQIDNFMPPKPKIRELTFNMYNNSYFGMASTTAKLSAEGVFIIIGGPRSGGYGKVHAYNNNFQLMLAKEGEQLGSSFGASLCAADVNGDKLDDLIVGAPLYTDKSDEGRVYVYINREFFNLELMTLLSGSNTAGSRFGTAVANIGDLNLDKYEDIVVGAPYEEESGVIYIYNGGKFGLRQEPSQRIVGKTLGNDLKTFGWSFSRPWDVDDNHYADFAVGAFESNKVVLLQGRSVVDLYANLEVASDLIDLKTIKKCPFRGQQIGCFEVLVCLNYSGQNLPPSAEVNITIRLDTLERHMGERSRLFMEGPNNTEVEKLNEILMIRLSRQKCDKKYIIYTRNSRDVITPLRIDLDYDISSSSIGIASNCRSICPIRNKYNPTTTHTMAYFLLECAENHVCHPDLRIEAKPNLKGNEEILVIDSSPYFDLELTITNQGEVSYLTTVTIEYPAYIYFKTTTTPDGAIVINCQPVPSIDNKSENSSISCDLLHPVRNGDKVLFVTRFYAHGTPYNVHKLPLNVSVASLSQRVGSMEMQKAALVSIPVQIKTEMKLSGVSFPGQLHLLPVSRTRTAGEEWASLSHVYILGNLGPSPMPHSQLTLAVPTSPWIRVQGVQVEKKSVTGGLSHVPVECNMSDRLVEMMNNKTENPGTSFITVLSCDSSPCAVVTCYVGLMHKYQTIYINVSLAVRSDVLQMTKVNDQLGLASSCQLQEPDYVSYTSLTTTFKIMTTTYILYKTSPGQAVNWWVLLISVSSGLLLLYILVVLLWKCGFFRRKRKEELQMLIHYFESEREILHSDSVSARSSDLMVLPPGLSSLHSSHVNHHASETPLFFPHGEDEDPMEYSYNQSYSLNRRKPNEPSSTFRTLQYHNNNKPQLSRPRSQQRNRDIQPWSHRNTPPNPFMSPPPNIWVPPPAPINPQPSFNNDLYLEPLESRA